MNTDSAYKDFIKRLKLLIGKQPELIATVLGNIFTMRLIGNKTHGDLAEIAISEFINQYMYDFRSKHVGKDLFRAKSKEEASKLSTKLQKTKFRSASKRMAMALCNYQQIKLIPCFLCFKNKAEILLDSTM